MATPISHNFRELIDDSGVDLFWSRVRKTSSCWLWEGPKDQDGYGQFFYNYRGFRAHRVALGLTKGGILPVDKVTDHICRRKSCVNPSHLRLISSGENVLCGMGITARNARKKRCLNGHTLTTIGYKKGRHCLVCNRMYSKRSKQKMKALKQAGREK